MTKVNNHRGIVRRLDPTEEPNPGGTLKVETTGGILVLDLAKQALQPTDYGDQRASLEKKLLRRLEKGEEASKSSAKLQAVTLSNLAKTCKLRLAIDLGKDEALEWEADLDFETSHLGRASREV